jgi:hypothetical protein
MFIVKFISPKLPVFLLGAYKINFLSTGGISNGVNNAWFQIDRN